MSKAADLDALLSRAKDIVTAAQKQGTLRLVLQNEMLRASERANLCKYPSYSELTVLRILSQLEEENNLEEGLLNDVKYKKPLKAVIKQTAVSTL